MMYVAVLINDPDRSIFASLVRIFTKSIATHVELVFTDGLATIVTPSWMELTKRKDGYSSYRWVKIPLDMISTTDEFYIRKYAEEIYSKNPKYDYLGAVSGYFGSSRQDTSKWYCGELVVELLKGYIPKLQEISWATPDALWRTLSEIVDKKQ